MTIEEAIDKAYLDGLGDGSRRVGHIMQQQDIWFAGGLDCQVGLFCHDKAMLISVANAYYAILDYYFNYDIGGEQ